MTQLNKDLNSKASAIQDELLQFCDGLELDYQVEQALLSSLAGAAAHYATHEHFGGDGGGRVANVIAAARFEYLLRHGRSSLSGLFSEVDVTNLLGCNQQEMFFPDRLGDLPDDLCHWSDVDPADYKSSEVAPLVEKVRALTALQRVALADALEQVWYIDYQQGRTVREAFVRLHIELCEPDALSQQ